MQDYKDKTTKNQLTNFNVKMCKCETFYNHNLCDKRFYLKVDIKQNPIRIDKFLVNMIQHPSRSQIKNAIKSGNILVNDIPVKQNYIVKFKDDVSFIMTDTVFNFIAENIPLNIVYEDEYLLVINKPTAMAMYPGNGNYDGTLLNALKYYLKKQETCKRMGIVHRVDKDTSGLIVVAKDNYNFQHLSRQFFCKNTHRYYLALVWGNIEKSGKISGNIGRSLSNRTIMKVFPYGSFGKPAVTYYKIREQFSYVTLLKCRLETGRTHQIRAHFKEIGHPLFNDIQYGGNQILKGTFSKEYQQFVKNCFSFLHGQFLHAQSLNFIHPISNKKMDFEVSLPKEMNEVLKKWRSYSSL